MKRRNFIKLAIGSSALATLPGVLAGPAFSADPIRVGVLLPRSGPGGLFGPSCENATNLAVTEINESGGILGRMVEPVFADAGGPPADATQAALKLWKGDQVDAFVGMHDSAVRGALTNLFKGEVPYIYTPVYEGGECSSGTYVLGETPAQQLAPVVPWMAENKGASKWYLIGNDYNWPRDTNAAAKGYIEASGGTVVGEEYLPFTADNFDSNLAKIKSSGADTVLITLVGGASVGFNRAFASFGLSDSVTRLGTLIEENTLAGIGAENSKNLFSSAGYFGSIDTPAAKAFAEKYHSTFGEEAAALNTLGESCYEGMKLLQALATKADSLDVAAFEGAADGTSYEGPRGVATMSDRHVSRDVYLAEADGASFKVIETFKEIGAGDNCS
ncbi:MAG: substrate-binding domain-containing protein [Pseudomonadota bacterium]